MKNITVTALSAASILGVASASFAAATHHDYLSAVAAYKPAQGFNSTVATKQFAGYFTRGQDACDVTVMIAEAGDEELRVKPVKVSFGIPAAGRSELMTDNGQVLALACTADADLLKVAMLSPRVM